jgi:hypothetical protein
VASALVLLNDVARGVDLVGKADHSAQAAGVGRRGGADGAEDVAGSVRVRIVVRPLRAAEHGRLVAPEQEVGKPAALLHRVDALRHRHAGDVVARQLVVDAQSQAKGELGGHVEARDGGEVVDLERRDLAQLRHLGEQILAALRCQVRPSAGRSARRSCRRSRSRRCWDAFRELPGVRLRAPAARPDG